jgi:hypothetical protein
VILQHVLVGNKYRYYLLVLLTRASIFDHVPLLDDDAASFCIGHLSKTPKKRTLAHEKLAYGTWCTIKIQRDGVDWVLVANKYL